VKPNIYIEAWRNRYDGEHWLAEVRDERNIQEYNNPQSWYTRTGWDYKYVFVGKKATVTFVSGDAFTRDEALAMSILIVEGRGVKAWRIDLN
jgi:hypothetical protein